MLQVRGAQVQARDSVVAQVEDSQVGQSLQILNLAQFVVMHVEHFQRPRHRPIQILDLF